MESELLHNAIYFQLYGFCVPSCFLALNGLQTQGISAAGINYTDTRRPGQDLS